MKQACRGGSRQRKTPNVIDRNHEYKQVVWGWRLERARRPAGKGEADGVSAFGLAVGRQKHLRGGLIVITRGKR